MDDGLIFEQAGRTVDCHGFPMLIHHGGFVTLDVLDKLPKGRELRNTFPAHGKRSPEIILLAEKERNIKQN